MADLKYNRGKFEIASGSIDLVADDIKVALVTSVYTPDIDAHTHYSNITNEVANGNGYTTGGASLANKSLTQDNTNDNAKYDADNVTWSTSTITARAAVLYKNTGVGATSPLIAYYDFGSDQTSTSGDFTINWNANGVLTIS